MKQSGGKKMNLSIVLADKIKKITALSHKTRLRIVLAIFNTEILKIGHSLTFSQLEKLLGTDKHEIAYHLSVLKEAHLITRKKYLEKGKKRTYYKTTPEGIEALNLLGMTEDQIKKMSEESLVACWFHKLFN